MAERKRQLILRTTTRCNFDCTFCSASKLQPAEMSAEDAIFYIKKYSPLFSLNFEGGDPLMRGTEFYRQVCDFVDSLEEESPVSSAGMDKIIKVCMTTNLWDFYKRPDKWAPVFNYYFDNISTSVDLDGSRRLAPNVPYTEAMFRSIVAKFRDYIEPEIALSFISVITENNYDAAERLCELGEEFGLRYRLNPVVSVGRSSSSMPFAKMFTLWVNLALRGYHEQTSKLLVESIRKNFSIQGCYFARDCTKWQVCINPDGSTSTCSIHASTLNNTESRIPIYTKLPPLSVVQNSCFTCPCFQYCNGCRLNISTFQHFSKQELQEHCTSMRSNLERLQEYALNGASQLNCNKK